jgi:hypothetical protein
VPGSTVFLEEQPNGDFVRRKSIDIRELKASCRYRRGPHD